MGHGDLPPAAVRFCLQGVALRGQLRPRRQSGPILTEEPAAQGPPRIMAGEEVSALTWLYGYRGGAALPRDTLLPSP